MTFTKSLYHEVPSVSIGIPTYNRAGALTRAIDSVLGQTHHDLELVISDNASSDQTQEICERYAEQDSRIRYLRHQINQGPTANFNILFSECRGDHVMMLSDDDWLEPDYVDRCLTTLADEPDYALVCGTARYFRSDGILAGQGAQIQLDQRMGAQRVISYFAQEKDNNGTFYGLMPRSVLLNAAPLLNVLANDWLLVAAIAYQGPIRTLPTTAINRTLGGTSADIASIGLTFGKSALQARMPHLIMGWHTFSQLGWRAGTYRGLSAPRRFVLALRCARLVINWKSLAWHLTSPTASSLERRPRGQPLARVYHSLTRRLGAGR
jgi:Glycosyl transferase family 2